MMTAIAPIAMYVVVGVGLPGGVTTGLGDVVKVGAMVGFVVEVWMGVGGGVITTEADGVGPTPSAVTAEELPYDSVPSNDAMMVYFPSIGGNHIVLNSPFMSLVTVPRSW